MNSTHDIVLICEEQSVSVRPPSAQQRDLSSIEMSVDVKRGAWLRVERITVEKQSKTMPRLLRATRTWSSNLLLRTRSTMANKAGHMLSFRAPPAIRCSVAGRKSAAASVSEDLRRASIASPVLPWDHNEPAQTNV